MPDYNNNTPQNPENPFMVQFVGEEKNNSIIKVIGVGGGGGNAVNNMYRKGIHDVTFMVCNTDKQVLDDSPVPVHLQLGKEGLGAGNKPPVGRASAEESIAEVKRLLSDGTKMAFITAGMGGGTGTGAGPVIARASKEMGILTVGIVTIPFQFEGKKKIDQALDGVEEMAKNVDALLVINNERILEIYSDLSMDDAFGKADETLSVAAKSIAEIITNHGTINLDFNDVKTVLKDGGVAIMSTGYGEGEGRVKMAINDALNSPLLSDNDVFNAKKILLSINYSREKSEKSGTAGLMTDEMKEVRDFMDKFGNDFEIKWGICVDPDLGKKVKVTILATGFGLKDVDGMEDRLRVQTEKEAEIEEKRKEQEAERDRRRGKYYPTDKGVQYKSHPRIFRFNAEDLDNEEVILAVEDTPTYKRTRQQLEEIRQHIAGQPATVEKKETSEPTPGIISFA